MAEIIKAGRKPVDIDYHTSCGNCHTHFKFKKYEAPYVGDQREGGFRVTCPFCNTPIWLNSLVEYRG